MAELLPLPLCPDDIVTTADHTRRNPPLCCSVQLPHECVLVLAPVTGRRYGRAGAPSPLALLGSCRPKDLYQFAQIFLLFACNLPLRIAVPHNGSA